MDYNPEYPPSSMTSTFQVKDVNHCFPPPRDLKAESQARWDLHFYEEAVHVARKSKDRATKCGCVVVNDRQVDLVRGWNGFPRGVDDDVDCRHERPAKYLWTEHAERNAIANAASEGIALRGSTMYVTGMPCCECARMIIQAGIRRLVTIEPDWDNEHWKATQHLDVSRALLSEGGVTLDFLILEENA
jgi:dCMP deaminase